MKTSKRRYTHRMRKQVDGLEYKHDNRCYYCGNKVSSFANSQSNKATVDHVEPRSSGASSLHSNLVLSCERCNVAKASMSQVDFLSLISCSGIIIDTKISIQEG